MNLKVSGVVVLAFFLLAVYWVATHSYLIVSVGSVLIILAVASVILWFLLAFRRMP